MTDHDPVRALMRILSERWVLSLAQRDRGDGVATTPLFFATASPGTIGEHEAPLLVFASDPASHHGELCGTGPVEVGAAVYLETETAGEIRGAQLRGTLVRDDRCTASAAAQLRERYLVRHPIAKDMLSAGRHHLYALIVTRGKSTDNRLGFGVHPEASFSAEWSGLSTPAS